jgi:AmmeMemoRadiSam system protein B
MPTARPSPIAGTWYPGEKVALEDSIEGFLAKTPDIHLPGELIGLIAPHAGHRFSGQVAAHAFRCAAGLQPEVVAIISPYHQLHEAELLTSGHESYGTPLGEVPIDHSLVGELRKALHTHELDLASVTYDQEHALEIELPFLQHVLPSTFTLLPIMMKHQSMRVAEALGAALAKVMDISRTLLVASTDLSHFYPAEKAKQFDSEILSRMQAYEPSRIMSAEEEGSGFACGRGAVVAALLASKEFGANHVQVLDYAHSGDITGDLDSVVGYAAAAILKVQRSI